MLGWAAGSKFGFKFYTESYWKATNHVTPESTVPSDAAFQLIWDLDSNNTSPKTALNPHNSHNSWSIVKKHVTPSNNECRSVARQIAETTTISAKLRNIARTCLSARANTADLVSYIERGDEVPLWISCGSWELVSSWCTQLSKIQCGSEWYNVILSARCPIWKQWFPCLQRALLNYPENFLSDFCNHLHSVGSFLFFHLKFCAILDINRAFCWKIFQFSIDFFLLLCERGLNSNLV